MGFGLTQYIPLVVYVGGLIAAVLSILISPVIGVLFLFPLLPYQIIFEKVIPISAYGKDLNDIIIVSITIGWFIRILSFKGVESDKSVAELGGLKICIFSLFVVTLIGFIKASMNFQLSIEWANTYLMGWKNYMLLLWLWVLTFKNIKSRKTFLILLGLLIIGILGAGYYFNNNLKWLHIWHFSDKSRDTMTGLFVYLGPNHYGAFFAHYIFILIGIFLLDKSKIRKVVFIGIILLSIRCLIYTYSRGAYLGLLTGILFIGIVKDKRLIILLVAFMIFWRFLVPISVVERVDMLYNQNGQLEESAESRLILWEEAWRMFTESPLLGQGFNTFRSGEYRDTHNYYMKMLAELGILGLLVFLWLLYISFIMGLKLYQESNDWLLKGLGLGFAACVVSVAVTNVFGDRWSYLPLGAYYWIFLGLVTRGRIMNKGSVEQAKL